MVRLRIDGILHTTYTVPPVVHNAMISRIKGLSRLDIAEKRRPQDGRIKLLDRDRDVEIRVSTIPVAFGEKAVLRILNPEVLFQDLEQLGFVTSDLLRYRSMLARPHGMILFTGPTGSGKTTSLYSTLRAVHTPEKNITTIEDPIEMVCEDYNQISVQPAIDVTFSSILRNILRQDPDIIMIGEIRDQDTARNAIQAALTGHLVLSTLHTNDAPSAVTGCSILISRRFWSVQPCWAPWPSAWCASSAPTAGKHFRCCAMNLKGWGSLCLQHTLSRRYSLHAGGAVCNAAKQPIRAARPYLKSW